MKPKLEYASHGPFVVEARTKLNVLMPEVQLPLKLDGRLQGVREHQTCLWMMAFEEPLA